MSRTPAQVFALVFGAVLTLAGVLGFFVSASFDVGSDTPRDTLVLFDVNGWHNLVHVASGALGLAVAGSVAAARTYALALGAVYVVVTIAGFIAGDGGTIIGLVPVNTEDNLLHLLIAIAGIGAGIATPEQPPPSTATAA
jgi:hypothetical protein